MSLQQAARKSTVVDSDDEEGVAPYQDNKDDRLPASLPFSAFVNPMKGGVLIKQGKKYKSWKKRLFLLEDKYLYYFVSADDKTPRGVIDLSNCRVEQETEVEKEKGVYCFSIRAEKSWNMNLRKAFLNRKYYFCTSILSEMNDWMALIRKISRC